MISVIPKIKQATLLYRGSRDGWKASDFHRTCDNKGPTVCLVKSSKGRICGGFTNVSCTTPSSGEYKSDSGALLFSVDHYKTYHV